jgi:hypothetical protein
LIKNQTNKTLTQLKLTEDMIITSISRVKKELAFLFISTILLENYAIAKIYNRSGEHTSLYVSAYKSERKQKPFADVYSPRILPSNNNSLVTNNALPAETKFAPEKTFVGGPGQPEMQSFQATGVSNMVDLFSGDFSYNIPLMDVGGYPINIHYNSGISMDQDASWVGLGWNINPGTISRSMRGLPDDFNGKDSVKKTLNIKPNITVGVTGDFNPEIVGKEIKLAKLNSSIEYNNYTGLGMSIGVSPTINSGKATLGKLTASLDKIDFSLGSKTGIDIDPTFSFQMAKQEGFIRNETNTSIALGFNSRRGLMDLGLSAGGSKSIAISVFKAQLKIPLSSWGAGTSISFGRASFTPSIEIPFTSFQFSFRAKGGAEIFPFHPLLALGGYYSQQYIAEKDRVRVLPAYGYMYYQEANDRTEVLLDYNRESDNTYTKDLPHIALPVYTHDLYSVTGEGIGGMFRPYRGDVGYIRDAKMRSRNHSGAASVDIGVGNAAHSGADISYNYSYTETNEWVKENSLRGNLRFRNNDTTFESVYFRNPGEKTINARAYYNAIGGDDLVRINLGSGLITPQATNNFSRFNEQQKVYATSSITNTTVKKERDKRTQVFAYLNAEEASLVGLDSMINIYPENVFFAGNCDTIRCAETTCDTLKREPRINDYRKAHHISEVIILNPDGKRYVYGIPAYNTKQTEVSFSVDKTQGNLSTGIAGYDTISDDSTTNNKGKDNFFSKEELPPFAHSYLLTGIVSADYTDVKGDGISDDDNGDAVKFNYSRVFSKKNPYKWRTPFHNATAGYSENLRTDKSDDKAHYVYGEKEIWYLNSVESKTMIATFTLGASTEARLDGRGAAGEDGGRDDNQKLRYLKRIDLYSKADFIKNGVNAKPVKTVHFAYSYKLCKGNPGSDYLTTGKLTLDTIWFSYNGNNKGKKNPYVFSYHANNPDYNARNTDRWGSYKNSADNPAAMLNSEFPYALQDSTNAANNAAAWTLQTIKLPSGGKIVVDFESDDYGYVQNKRATQMFKIAGFSNDPGTAWNNIENVLYKITGDQYYMYVEFPVAVNSKKEFFERYLQDIGEKLYFRAAVQMPKDSYGDGYELVSGYSGWSDYGVVGSGSTTKAWIKLKQVKGMSPIVKAALQFLRLNLPSKAYPGSDVKEDAVPKAIIKVLGSFASNIFQLINTFDGSSKIRGWCKNADLSKSIVRLANPSYKKYGGGLRVKRVQIYDNWNAMSGQKESFYGQEYNYTTVEEINGVKTVISSGVATYEPTIGNEENPFHMPLEYAEQSSILAPTFGRFIDNPVGESFFPSPSIGYSKVRVASIKRKNVKSATGYEESEFYTAKDFPIFSDFTAFDRASKRQFRSPLRFFLKIDLRHYLTMSQGFRVQLNDMHGKMKSKSVFAENDTTGPLSYVKNFYKVDQQNTSQPKLNNTVSVVENTSGAINSNAEIGKDVELMVDMRQQISDTWGGNIQFNNDFFIIPTPIPIPTNLPSWIPVPNHDLKQFRSVTVVKIVSRYGILDSVVQIEKGSKVSVKNLLYDAETGDVVLSRTQNEFDDPVYNFSYAAYQAYDALGLAYKNVGAVFPKMTMSNGRLSNTYYDKFFTGGDEILFGGFEYTFKCDYSSVLFGNFKPTKLWAIEGSKIGKPNGIYFIDRKGKLFTGFFGTIKIIRSGRRNLLGEVGSVVSLANPIVPDGSGGQKLLFDNATNVINASAAEYKESWKVEDRFVTKDTTYVSINTGSTTLYPIETIVKRKGINADNFGSPEFRSNITNEYIAASMDYVRERGCHNSYRLYAKTAIKYDFTGLPSNLILDSAKLGFTPGLPSSPPLFDQICKGAGQFCQTDCSFYFPNATQFYNRTNWSYLKRVSSSWNGSLAYDDNQYINSTNQVTVSNTAYQNINCKLLIQDCINNPSYGLMMELGDQQVDDQESNETNYLAFCGGVTTSQIAGNKSFFRKGVGGSEMSSESSLASCAPGLDLWYKYSVITTETLCKSALTQVSSNPYVMGYLGNWRPYRSYTYFDDRKETDMLLTNIRTDGTFKTFSPFWNYTSNGLTAVYDSAKWVWNSEITKVNRKGMELENKDPLGRYNAGLYGYNLTLPVAVAQNSKYKEIAFDGFEDYGFKNDLCAKACSTFNHFNLPINIENDLSTQEKHSGKYSLKVNQNNNVGIYTEIPLVRPQWDSLPVGVHVQTDTNSVFVNLSQTNKYCYEAVHTDSSSLLPRYSPVPGSKIVVGAWVKEAKDCKCESYTENSISVIFRQTNGTDVTYTLKPAGNIIEGWQRIDSAITVPANTVAYKVLFNASPSSTTYFDDFRIQPFNSNLKSFVYNAVNLRLMAELDENNYATFYEYDDDGTLIRVKKETERGIKTIKETRSALLKQ